MSSETDDGEKEAENNDIRDELFGHLDEEVEVTGIVKKEKEVIRRIKNMSYRALGREQDDENYGD